MELVWKEIMEKNSKPRLNIILFFSVIPASPAVNKHVFSQQICTEILLCARHFCRCWDTMLKKMGNSEDNNGIAHDVGEEVSPVVGGGQNGTPVKTTRLPLNNGASCLWFQDVLLVFVNIKWVGLADINFIYTHFWAECALRGLSFHFLSFHNRELSFSEPVP